MARICERENQAILTDRMHRAAAVQVVVWEIVVFRVFGCRRLVIENIVYGVVWRV